MRKIEYLIIHTSDSPDSLKLGAYDIDQWHKQRGWDGCGYNYVVNRDGIVELGRLERETPAGARGYNKNGIHIVWMGRNIPTEPQLHSLSRLSYDIMLRHDIPINKVLGHTELPGVSKTCPNIDMTILRTRILQGKYHMGDNTWIVS